MVNPEVYNYLQKTNGKYDLNLVRKKIIAAGYSAHDYEEAMDLVRGKSSYHFLKKKGLGILIFIIILLLFFLIFEIGLLLFVLFFR